jgi:hypothetical protein
MTAAACRYLLVALLQRLEKRHPGLIIDMQAGVAADRNATSGGQPHVEATFGEALRILEIAARG